MKKISVILNVILLILLAVIIVRKNDSELPNFSNDNKDSAYGVNYYPLLNMPIRYNESDIVLIIVNNVMQSDKSEYFFTNDKETLENMQTVFKVISFPVDRGTTPDSMVYIYQDNILIKEIPFFGIYNNEENFNLDSLSKLEIEAKIDQELQPPI